TYHSCLENFAFWQTFPELIWAASNRGIGRTTPRQPISAFYLTFARLAAFFVRMDTQVLADAVSDFDTMDSGRIPDLLSSGYLAGLHTLTRRDEPRILNNREVQGAWLRPDGTSEMVQRIQTMPGGSLQALTGLVEEQIKLMEKFPRLVDLPGAACQVASDLMWETERRLHFPGQPQQVTENLKQRLSQGHRFFVLVTQALHLAVEKLVNHLTTDGASSQILFLTDIYQCALRGDHELATELLSDHRQKNPDLPAYLAPGAIAWEWRFNMFEKLIMSSQMQLRVWAVSHMCTDLVMFWRRYGEMQDDLSPFLAYFAEYLKRTKLVEYILGPTCHPEITLESGNVVGFLLVTKFYQREQTDLLWQTITSSQDRRVADAVTRMTANIAHLYDHDQLIYLCEKLQTLPVESFGTAPIRFFCEQIFKSLATKCSGERIMLNHVPFELCLRLLRESSVYSAQSQVAYPEIQAFATQKLRDLHQHGPDPEGRRRLYLSCIEDIAERSPTTLGSLSGLFVCIRHAVPVELKVLTTEHCFARLLVDELDHVISVSRSTSGLLVIAGPSNTPRREFIYNLISYEPDSLTDGLGRRLWDMMVGPAAIAQDDRTVGWGILNNAASQAGFDNPFLSTCLSDHFSSLPSDCFCAGALRFLREGIISRANGHDIALDNPDHVRHSGIEELWRMILTTPDLKVAESAIDLLVKDIYIDSRVVLDYPHHRARQVHLGLVNRCLNQLNEAARVIMSSGEDSMGGDDDSMVIVATEATDAQLAHQERVFLRSLAALKRFLQAHQSKAHFAAADLRPLMPPSPTTVVGESAELKFQSFDGDKQTDVQPLNIGRQNTGASLLASLKEVTGFDNYRIYYKGQAFVPRETEICKSLVDLQIHD
ncbi:hypothetical protein IMZ48_41925, partial [Candidatus Bathyarchaeota archaeon]|nr:hypothetical protein [Candidatus Bathyarchaeota archaeon]